MSDIKTSEADSEATTKPAEPKNTRRAGPAKKRRAATGARGPSDAVNPKRAERISNNKTERRARKKKRRKAKKAQIAAASAAHSLPEPVSLPTTPVAGGARLRFRHILIMISFLVAVVLPSAGAFVYLRDYAADQYVSKVGFSVRTEEAGSALELLGGISAISNGSSSDTDILYEFIQSQKLVEQVDARLDLRALFSKPENDSYFAFDEEGSLEDLVSYWNSMVKIFYSGSNGLIQLRVHAFAAEDATLIANTIFEESSLMINRLSAIAREDSTGYAADELELSVERLKEARQALTAFRNKTQIVDPNADLQGQMGLINTLQQQLAAALIEKDLLLETTRAGDPRVSQADRKVEVIRARIQEEREKFTQGSGRGELEAYSTLISTYEGLVVEREFAEQFYLSALQTYDAARAEAQRQSRYLAAYVEPTKAESAEYPQRGLLWLLLTVFALLSWAILVLIVYSIKDRR